MSNAATPADTDGLATFVVGDAVAIGEDTLSSVSATSRIVDSGNKIKAEGFVTATAVASSSPDATTLASADTNVAVVGADKVVVKTKEISIQDDEGSYSTSTTKFKAIDRSRTDDETQETVNKQVSMVEGQKTVMKSIHTLNKNDDGSYETSVTKVKHHEHPGGDADYLTELDGNVASATFDAPGRRTRHARRRRRFCTYYRG